jgi:hypothetical protein
MPPSHLKKPQKGHRKRESLPNQFIFILKAKTIASPMGKSQFEVCGAAITTNLGMFGSWPDLRHPKILKTTMERICSRFLRIGISKMV